MKMEQYKLEPSLVVAIDENTIPKNGLKISFLTGTLEGEDYAVSRLNSFWALFGIVARGSKSFLVSVKYCQLDMELLIVKNGEEFSVFADRGDGDINLIGNYIRVNTEYFPVIDPRWNLVYFIPRASLLKFVDLVKIVNMVINNKSIDKVTHCPQSGDEIMSIYKEVADTMDQ